MKKENSKLPSMPDVVTKHINDQSESEYFSLKDISRGIEIEVASKILDIMDLSAMAYEIYLKMLNGKATLKEMPGT